MGVSAGAGMIHYVLLTRDDLGRSVVDSRVIDVDPTDGLDAAGRVNAGIDMMLTAAREADIRVGPIGIATRTGGQRRQLRSRGSGPRRQVRLLGEAEGVLTYLADTGEIDRFTAAVVVDCGDTGMSLYTVDPRDGRVIDPEHSTVLSGRRLDRAIVANLTADNSALNESSRSRPGRSELLSACRTAKEEVAYGRSAPGDAAVPLSGGAPTGGSGRLSLNATHVEDALAPMIREAREVFTRYVTGASSRGVRPEAVVFIGGLANLPMVRTLADGHDLETVCPADPELVVATGAALLAHETYSGAVRLAFIGGNRQREWLSATPLAVAGAVIAAMLMTIYAVSSSFADRQGPEPERSVSSVPAVATTSEPEPVPTTTVTEPVTQTSDNPVEPTFVPPTQTEQPVPPPEWGEPPAWATTELPPTRPSTGTTTRTLSPFPWPTLTFPPGTTPTIPQDLLPPDMRPPNVAPTPPPPTYPTTTSARSGPAAPTRSGTVPDQPRAVAPEQRELGKTAAAPTESSVDQQPAPGSAPSGASPVPSVPVPSVPAPR
ncbi:hypothetical protein [Gordonia jinghuaiqii]|uniref:Hsp70 family protein n=1 Tax=Gordonia jinghuaiqii TaxID=2758710 RepID=A0A7D7LZP1_9ACTN|nr:hypothetical protein [Gordonia jinghuaiqii]QMT03799.1 hypothetical protein H1R19_08430 [Gordonia jinghuaiqii]